MSVNSAIRNLHFAIALLALASPVFAQQQNSKQAIQKRSACQLVSLEEIAKLTAAGPVEIIPDASGPADGGASDACAWRVKGSQATLIEMVIENLDVPDLAEKLTGKLTTDPRVAAKFKLRKTQAFSDPPEPAVVPGLGDQALYRDFQRAKGGALLVRRGSRLFSCSGSLPKETYIGLARLVLQRW